MHYPDYDPRLDTPPLSDAELDALDDLLQSLPSEAAMNVEALDGFLAALAAGPVDPARVRSAVWLPAVWGGDGEGSAPFSSEKQRKRTVLLVLRHLHMLQRQFEAGAQAWEPVFSIAEDGEREWLDAEDWCAGFLHAAALWPEAWAPAFEAPPLAEALAPLVLLGGEGDALAGADAEARDRLSRQVVDGMLVLRDWSAARRGTAG